MMCFRASVQSKHRASEAIMSNLIMELAKYKDIKQYIIMNALKLVTIIATKKMLVEQILHLHQNCNRKSLRKRAYA